MDKVAEFKKELKELLEKYEAEIYVECSSESYISALDEAMTVNISGSDYKICDGWGIVPDDLN